MEMKMENMESKWNLKIAMKSGNGRKEWKQKNGIEIKKFLQKIKWKGKTE